jgi:hypothetical protein
MSDLAKLPPPEPEPNGTSGDHGIEIGEEAAAEEVDRGPFGEGAVARHLETEPVGEAAELRRLGFGRAAAETRP